jgi:PQQ-dependent dehydrogenase (methanol/ethanol family)
VGALAWAIACGLLAGCGAEEPAPPAKALAPVEPFERPLDPAERIRAATATLDDARLRAAASEPSHWLTYGGTLAEQRYSSLDQIDDTNVAQLGLAWSFETDTTRGLEATPLVVDGVLFITGSWSVVFAVDGRTGKQLWKYDPQVPRETGGKACCDVVNRGVALYRGRVYVGTLDGRLVALDAATGTPVWETQTVDPNQPYTITGAPRIVKGKVIIGNGGAELGVRGYVSAYDAATGELRWRTYTVPGDPAKPFESPAMEQAAATWTGEWWKMGGGGTVWDSMAYDPDLDLLYVGTGNGSPWNRRLRSPGGGDNLYLSSILALRPDTGEQVWHYQTTPGDTWDYTATQHILLADLEIDGRRRKVAMQAPKNGFFYVLDRGTGELLSADPFAQMNWATGMDMATGRPVEAPGSRYENALVEIRPSPYGAHSWHPMSYNPRTGLVYIPVLEVPYNFRDDPEFRYRPGSWNLGIDTNTAEEFPRERVSGHLLAWDPVARREAWRVQYAGPWNGGTLTTAGNLVLQGTGHGTFAAYRATDGARLFETPAGTGVVAPPVTYLVDGEQHVAVMAGWGGAFALNAGDASAAAGVKQNAGRLLVFRLGGTAKLPVHEAQERELVAIPAELDPAEVKEGVRLYNHWCQWCHGSGVVSGGVLPDLRLASAEIYDQLAGIVLGGSLRGKGMPAFAEWLGEDDLRAIRSYLLSRRAALIAERAAPPAEPPAPG